MSKLAEEVLQWNSPSIGAYLLWRFTSGYCDAHPSGDAPVALLHFLAMPLLISQRLLKPISRRREDLQSYVRSFEKSKESDILTSIHDRVRRNRSYTIAAIDIAVSTGLVCWDADSGKIYPSKDEKKPRWGNSLKQSVKRDGYKAEILGGWFAEHSIEAIATYLEVVL